MFFFFVFLLIFDSVGFDKGTALLDLEFNLKTGFLSLYDWLVGCFGLNGPLRQYFSLYRAVSQREGERKEK